MNVKKSILSLTAGLSLAGCVQVGSSPSIENLEQKEIAKDIFEEFQKSGNKEGETSKHKQALLSYGYICDAANILSEDQELSHRENDG